MQAPFCANWTAAKGWSALLVYPRVQVVGDRKEVEPGTLGALCEPDEIAGGMFLA